MARFRRQRGDEFVEVEISDAAAVALALGLAGAAVAATWMVTQSPEALRALERLAATKGVRLLSEGRPLERR